MLGGVRACCYTGSVYTSVPAEATALKPEHRSPWVSRAGSAGLLFNFTFGNIIFILGGGRGLGRAVTVRTCTHPYLLEPLHWSQSVVLGRDAAPARLIFFLYFDYSSVHC